MKTNNKNNKASLAWTAVVLMLGGAWSDAYATRGGEWKPGAPPTELRYRRLHPGLHGAEASWPRVQLASVQVLHGPGLASESLRTNPIASGIVLGHHEDKALALIGTPMSADIGKGAEQHAVVAHRRSTDVHLRIAETLVSERMNGDGPNGGNWALVRLHGKAPAEARMQVQTRLGQGEHLFAHGFPIPEQ